jgi:hypothetical protein
MRISAPSARSDPAAALAVGAWLGEQALEVRAAALAGDLDQAELRDRQHLGLRPVLAQLLLERGEDLRGAPLGHVDQVDDDDAAQVAQPDLADDLATASRLVFRTVSSRLVLPTKRPVLTSIATSASVGLITM